MRRACVLALAVAVVGCAGTTQREHGAAPHVDDWGAPQIALAESPLVHVRFVLYASGRVVYSDDRVGTVAGYATVALTDSERSTLLADLAADCVGHMELPDREGADGAIWKRLAHFSSPRAVAWIPDAISVGVRPWRWWNREDHCGTPPASPWPKQWPKPQPPMPLWGWSLPFPLDELPRLRAITARTRQGCSPPIELRGERYEVTFGMSLPHERELWKN